MPIPALLVKSNTYIFDIMAGNIAYRNRLSNAMINVHGLQDIDNLWFLLGTEIFGGGLS
jgi:hypothetical protein